MTAPETVIVAGTTASFRRSGRAGAPTLMFLHCGGGHSGWWDDVLPSLADDFRLITVDLSGHGDAGHRDAYEPDIWADEVRTIAQAVGGPVTLVGHSMGGLVGIYAAGARPDLIKRLILVDPPVLHVERRDVPVRSRVYPAIDEMIDRFVLRPPETIAPADRIRRIARQGLRAEQGGWGWKYDPRASQRFTIDEVADALRRVKIPVACIYGGSSPYADAETIGYMSGLLGRPVPSEVIPGAFHHVPLDAPEALAGAIPRLAP